MPNKQRKPIKFSTDQAASRYRNVTIRSSVIGMAVVALLSFGGVASLDSGVYEWMTLLRSPIITADDMAPPAAARADLLLRDADIHPSRIYDRYLSNQSRTPDARSARIAREFQDLISLYETRQGIDDNFTLRIIDNRTGGLIEIVTLDSARAEFERTGTADWNKVDVLRRARTSEIVKEHAKSFDREFITVKWGRRNEILEARTREIETVEHEVRLARALGLSLLTTEIGTVETFNNDALVSRVGARSRYQLMPSILRELGINHYTLKTATGKSIRVQEEMHPLISMEAAYTVVKAYSNAMGHEIPGISAYHAGPFNVFRLYERYLSPDNDLFDAYSTVVTAYLWGLTEGFDQVTEKTTFGTHSRNYIPSVFGALEATADIPIDTSRTWIAELVELRSGTSLFLSDLLDAVDGVAPSAKWRTDIQDSTTYQRFRSLNPHIALPEFGGKTLSESVDVKLTATSGGKQVRFFLPLGTAKLLKMSDKNWFNDSEIKTWSHGPFYDLSESTAADARYDSLVSSVIDFRFTTDAVDQLESLYFEFQSMAKANPTWYRKNQYNIIRLHRRVWRAGNYERLANASNAARARVSMEPLSRLQEFEPLPSRPTLPVPSGKRP